jgi:HAD superfamily hydrolase (TIGR01509 family)
MAGMYELVKQLSEKYPLGLLSDTDPLHWNYIVENYPIVKFFPNPVLSFTCGMSKPDKKIFELAAKSVNTPPKNCVYIDDLPKNTAGAESIGIKAIKFESAQQLKRELIALKVLTAE